MHRHKNTKFVDRQKEENKEVAGELVGFGLGILYVFFLRALYCVMTIFFVSDVLLPFNVIHIINLVLCIFSTVLILADFFHSVYYLIRYKDALSFLDILITLIYYIWPPILLLVLTLLFL